MLGELERQGLIVDLAHMSEAGVADSLELLSKPPVISHTALRDDSSRGSRWRRYSAATRNVSPELARDVAARGGLVGIVLATQLLGGDSLRHAAEAVARALETCGADGVALGSDMDGALKMVIDHQGLPALADELLGSGLDRSAVGGYLGANAIRFLEAVLPS